MIVKHHGKTKIFFDVLLCRQALWLHQERTQMVCSNEEARKRLAEASPQWTLDTWILFQSDVFVMDLGNGMEIIMIIKTITIVFCLGCTKGMWAPLIDVLRGCEHPTSH